MLNTYVMFAPCSWVLGDMARQAGFKLLIMWIVPAVRLMMSPGGKTDGGTKERLESKVNVCPLFDTKSLEKSWRRNTLFAKLVDHC